jgi:hypothetical protein
MSENVMSDNINTKPEIVKTDDRKTLVEIIRASHQAVRNAAHNILREAITAGEALLKLKESVGHGEWGHYLRRHCELSERTAQVYMRLAEHRAKLEANPQRAADLSLRGALKLIGKEPDKGGKSAKSAKATASLSTLAWSNATAEERQRFVTGIGLVSWLAAIPPTWREDLERRIDGQRRAKSGSQVNTTISKALRQALSLQKTAKGKDNTSAAVAAALNGILNKLNAAGLDLNDLDVVVQASAAKRAA